MKRKILFITFLFLIVCSTISLGTTLTLKLETDKKSVKKGDTIKVYVNWSENMQAADFSLNYDNKVLKFLKSDINNFCMLEENEIKIAWFSMDDTDKTSLEFEFEALEKGETTISTKINAGFADKNLNEPENYNNDSIQIKVKNSFSPFNIVLIIVLIIIFAFIIIKLLRVKNKKRAHINKKKR